MDFWIEEFLLSSAILKGKSEIYLFLGQTTHRYYDTCHSKRETYFKKLYSLDSALKSESF